MKIWIGIAGCSLVAAGLAGCSPELAQTPLGSEEETWKQAIKSSYPSWKPPRVAPPGIQDNMSDKYVPEEPVAADPNAVPPAIDDKAAPAPAPAAADTAAPVAADLPAPAEAAAAGDSLAADVKAPAAEAAAPAAEVDFTEYEVVKGDSLSVIAKKVYKDGRLYYPILKANEAVLKGNPNRIYPGMKLRIPKR